jgi:hypothetical protein
MRRPTAVLSALVVGIGALGLPGLAAATDPRPRSPLTSVAALDKPVTYTETKIPLGELIQKVAVETGVRLTATADVADEPVAVVVNELPARELLEQLAEHFDYLWSRRGKEGEWRYEIWQDLAAKNREAALREARVVQAEQRLRDEVRRYLEIARLPEAQHRAMVEELNALERQMERLSLQQVMGLFFTGQLTATFQRVQRLETARRLSPPISRSLAQLLGRLSPAHWAELSAGRPVVFSTSTTAGEAALPEEAVRTFRATPVTFPEHFAPDDPPEDVAEIRRHYAAQEDRWKSAAGYRVTISEDRSGLSTMGSLSLDIRVQPTRTADATDAEQFSGEATSLHLTSRGGSEAQEQMLAGLSPERLAENERDPLLRVRKSLQRAERMVEGGTYEAFHQRQAMQFLLSLVRAYEVHAIADTYGMGLPSSFTGSELYSYGPLPLWQLLDIACGPSHRWDHRGRVIRIRSRKWFIERPREIPERLIREWKAQTARRGSLTLDAWTHVAALRDPQLENLSSLVSNAGLPQEFQQVHYHRHLLRLYAALSAGQRQALWEGRRLSLAAMLPRQRQLFVAALRELNVGLAGELDPEWLAAAGLSLEQTHLIRVREDHGDIISYGEENVTPSEDDPPPAPVPSAADPTGRRPRVTRHPVIAVQFFAHYGPNAHGSVITVAPPP